MVIDTSAIVAIALNEPDTSEMEIQIADEPIRSISAATELETAMVLKTRLGDVGGRQFNLWLSKSEPRLSLSTPNRAMRRGALDAATSRGIRQFRWQDGPNAT